MELSSSYIKRVGDITIQGSVGVAPDSMYIEMCMLLAQFTSTRVIPTFTNHVRYNTCWRFQVLSYGVSHSSFLNPIQLVYDLPPADTGGMLQPPLDAG